VYVPLLLVAHFYSLRILSQRSREKNAAIRQVSAGVM